MHNTQQQGLALSRYIAPMWSPRNLLFLLHELQVLGSHGKKWVDNRELKATVENWTLDLMGFNYKAQMLAIHLGDGGLDPRP